ncbi:hypothetical protein HWV62_40820 [Athelia sp. TMB]|nr:hypothetical protein HWV62_40820 [Athelia sp. TMB]
MRSFSSITALTLSALAIFAAAHDSEPAAHKRMLARRSSTKKSCSVTHNTTSSAKGSATSAAAVASPTSSGNSTGLKFPELGFKMPSAVPSSLDGWWADPSTEYAFVGFSYEISACQSQSQLTKDFKNMRTKFNARYVRLYGACVQSGNKMKTKTGYYDTVVEAAWEAGLGVHALIWFGFDGGSLWEDQRDTLFTSISTNPKSKFVTRVVQFGSEPLFDSVLPAKTLASQVTAYKKKLEPYQINVTVSELVYGFEETSASGRTAVLEAMDNVHVHTLPFFDTAATSGSAAMPLVQGDIKYFMNNAASKGKKIYMDENGWPSTTYSGVEANSKKAVASVNSEQQYFDLLDAQCTYFKETNGGIAWFFHIYSDEQEPGYGLYSTSNKLKFPFAPKTSC